MHLTNMKNLRHTAGAALIVAAPVIALGLIAAGIVCYAPLCPLGLFLSSLAAFYGLILSDIIK